MPLLSGLLADCRYALRQLRRTPAFFLIAVVLVGVGTGGNITAFSLLNAFSLQALSVPAANRIVAITATDEGGQQPRPIYYQTFAALRTSAALDGATLYSGGGVLWTEARGVTGEGAIEAVTPGFHEMLGLAPALGRFLTTDDAPQDGIPSPVAVISHRFWQRAYGGDRNVIGERLLINKVPFTVIGVTPQEYKGLYLETGVDFAVPLSSLGRQLGTNQYPLDPKAVLRGQQVIARLKTGATIDDARAAAVAAWPALRIETAPPNLSPSARSDMANQRISVDRLSNGFSSIRTRYADRLRMFSVTTAVLVAIAALNIAGLLLVNLASHADELAVHRALGASTACLIRRVALQAGVVAVAGTLAGIAIAWWAGPALTAMLWESIMPIEVRTAPDAVVTALAFLTALLTTVIIASLPAFVLLRRVPENPLVRRTVAGRVTPWTKAVVAAQVTLSLALTSMAGIFAVDLYGLRRLDTGIEGAGLRWTRLLQQPGGYRDLHDDGYYPELVRALSSQNGIESVALTHHFPAFFNFPAQVTRMRAIPSLSRDPDRGVEVVLESISPGFFDTARLPLARGRDIEWRDRSGAPPVAIVNRSLARALFDSDDVIGRHLDIGDDGARQSVEIVGVAPDATIGGYRQTGQPVVFRPKLQEPRFTRMPVVLFRSALPPAAADRLVAETVRGLGREYVRRTYSFDEQIDIALLNERLAAIVSAILAAVGVSIGGLGLCAVLAYIVTTRTREIGVRIALGASVAQVQARVLRDGIAIVAFGLVAGVPLSMWALRAMRGAGEGSAAASAWLIGAIAVMFLALAGVACVAPMRRAGRTAPAVLLRAE